MSRTQVVAVGHPPSQGAAQAEPAQCPLAHWAWPSQVPPVTPSPRVAQIRRPLDARQTPVAPQSSLVAQRRSHKARVS